MSRTDQPRSFHFGDILLEAQAATFKIGAVIQPDETDPFKNVPFYFNKKMREIEIIRAENSKPISFSAYKVKEWKKEANSALKRYTAKLNEEVKLEKEACSITG